MDKIRLVLWFGLLASIWISYTTWVEENRPPAVGTQQTETASGDVVPGVADDLPALEGDADVPSVGDVATGAPGGIATGAPGGIAPADDSAAPTRAVSVRTDVLDLVIDLNGGDIVRVDLPEYPVDKKNPDVKVRLLDYTPEQRWVFQTGLVSGPDAPAPTHEQPFTSDSASYVLADGQDSLEIRLQWAGPPGLMAEKVYTFQRGEYSIDLDLVVHNNTAEPWPTRGYAQIRRLHIPHKRRYMDIDSYSFTGPAFYDGSGREKIDFEELKSAPIDQTVPDGWIASIQHYFVSAIVPRNEEPTTYEARAVTNDTYRLQARGPTVTVEPGGQFDYPVMLFVGPKLQEQLAESAPGRELRLAVDYKWLTVLSQPLFLLLNFIHGFVKNWGLSIILTTFLIKLAFYKLTATSGRSMAKMRKLAPRMKALQEKHKDDRQALSAAMMELYKKEKVNPAAGCLPILVQMPFFFAFYWVLIESVEMRQAPFFLWIQDLSVRDPFFVLPLLMLGAMMFQMRLNPTPPDPVQARVMQIMPIFFSALFAFFPAGLVLYWLTNTVTSIAQQWRINQLVARES